MQKKYLYKIFLKLRLLFYSFLYYPSIKKIIFIGRNTVVRGNVKIGYYIMIDNNVEVRNNSEELSTIGNNCSINRNTVLRGKYSIGDYVAIGPNCSVMGFNHRFDNLNENISKQGRTIKGIIIENNVWIGANTLVLDGVTIGEGCVIGGGSVVTKSIPPFSVAAGNPCKVIKRRIQL